MICRRCQGQWGTCRIPGVRKWRPQLS